MSERIRQLERYVAELVRRVEETERRLANVMRPSRIAQVVRYGGIGEGSLDRAEQLRYDPLSFRICCHAHI